MWYRLRVCRKAGSGMGGGFTSLADVRNATRRVQTLNQQITRAQNNIQIAEGRVSRNYAAALGATESGQKRIQTARNSYDRDKTRLDGLIKERDNLNRRLEQWRRRQERNQRGGPF